MRCKILVLTFISDHIMLNFVRINSKMTRYIIKTFKKKSWDQQIEHFNSSTKKKKKSDFVIVIAIIQKDRCGFALPDGLELLFLDFLFGDDGKSTSSLTLTRSSSCPRSVGRRFLLLKRMKLIDRLSFHRRRTVIVAHRRRLLLRFDPHQPCTSFARQPSLSVFCLHDFQLFPYIIFFFLSFEIQTTLIYSNHAKEIQEYMYKYNRKERRRKNE